MNMESTSNTALQDRPRTSSGYSPKRSPADTTRNASAGENYGLKVAVLYQDKPTWQWAARTCNQAIRLAGAESIHASWWDLNRFGDRQELLDAALTAMQADIIVVSIYDTEELPSDLCAWMDAWLPHRLPPVGALIVLLGVPDVPGARFRVGHDYLQEGARKGRLDLLLRVHPVPAVNAVLA